MSPESLLNRLRKDDTAAFAEVDKLLTSDPKASADLAWKFLTDTDGRSSGGLCVTMLMILTRALGTEEMERLILDQWPKLTEFSKMNICYAASNPDVFSTELAVRLFNSAGSTVHDRHLIAAGVVVSARKRQASELAGDMLSRIGTYDNEHRQKILETFLAKARQSLTQEQ